MSEDVKATVRYVARVALVGYLISVAVAVGLLLTHHLNVWAG